MRREFALIIYQKNQLGIEGPRKVNVAIPKIQRMDNLMLLNPFLKFFIIIQDLKSEIIRIFEKFMQINS